MHKVKTISIRNGMRNGFMLRFFLKLLHNQTKLGLVLFYTFSHPGWLEINFYVFTKKLLWLFGWNKEKGNTHMYISFSVELFLLLSRSLDLVWFYFTLFFFVFFLHTLYYHTPYVPLK